MGDTAIHSDRAHIKVRDPLKSGVGQRLAHCPSVQIINVKIYKI